MLQDNNSLNIKTIKLGEKEIILVGTAHVSQESREEVEKTITEVNPDTVCVELCESRYQSLKDKDRWSKLDIIQVLKSGKGFLLFANMVLSSFQKKIGLNLDSAPGEEMIAAVRLAEEKGIGLVLADRDVNVTLKRAWKLSKFMGKVKILSLLLDSLFTNEDIKQEDIQELMKGDNLMNEMMDMFAAQLPSVKQVLIDERDQFLAHKIKNANGNRIVAVVGKGHMAGIIKTIENDFEYNPSIEIIPPDGILGKVLPWIITLAVLGVFVAGFIMGGMKTGLSMLLTWVLVTGTTTAISALLVLSNPITILSSWIVAPITTLNPFLGAGMILALIEAILVKPRVSDFENIANDIASFKGFFKNRITKILMIFVITSIGASIGTFVGIPWVSSILGKVAG